MLECRRTPQALQRTENALVVPSDKRNSRSPYNESLFFRPGHRPSRRYSVIHDLLLVAIPAIPPPIGKSINAKLPCPKIPISVKQAAHTRSHIFQRPL